VVMELVGRSRSLFHRSRCRLDDGKNGVLWILFFFLSAIVFSLRLVWIIDSVFILSTLEVDVDLSFGSDSVKHGPKNRFETKNKGRIFNELRASR
jgi:hypothetical protein